MAQANLAERISRLETIEAIQQLKARYCAYCDDNYNPEGIGSLFVEDGIWDGERFGRYVGREQIKAFFRSISGEIVFAAHLVLNPIVEVQDADNATGKWRLIMPATFRSAGKNEARWLVSAYDDSFVRVGGTWMFKTLRVHVNFLEPHQGTWASSAVL
jgi:hypothetical protein